jgi:hypothetical protein
VLEIVRVLIHVPDVRHVVFLEVGVDILADADEAVLVATGEVEKLELLRGIRRIRASSAAGLVLGADEKPPTQAKVARLPRPKFKDCPPPIESPASARLSRSWTTEYLPSMNGMRLPSKSWSNTPKAGASPSRSGRVDRPAAPGRWASR